MDQSTITLIFKNIWFSSNERRAQIKEKSLLICNHSDKSYFLKHFDAWKYDLVFFNAPIYKRVSIQIYWNKLAIYSNHIENDLYWIIIESKKIADNCKSIFLLAFNYLKCVVDT